MPGRDTVTIDTNAYPGEALVTVTDGEFTHSVRLILVEGQLTFEQLKTCVAWGLMIGRKFAK